MSESQIYRASCDRTLTDLFRNVASEESYVRLSFMNHIKLCRSRLIAKISRVILNSNHKKHLVWLTFVLLEGLMLMTF